MKKPLFFLFPLCLSLVVFLLHHFFLLPSLSVQLQGFLGNASLPCEIVIDAGHGGADPGKVGINQVLEKDVNLSIACFLAEYLTASGYSLQMTRTKDISLADPSASNQKLSDFEKRVSLIEKYTPSIVISIHQNSYPDENIQGTQVFHSSNPESARLADCIQSQCRRLLSPENQRNIKENSDYYLFRHISCPIVIVECGFLSNPSEAASLSTEKYQQKTAWAIHMGIVQYLKLIE